MTQDNILIRPEVPEDAPAVYAINAAAFGRPAEARLVERLRSTGITLLSLVAEANGRVVGHALFTAVTLQFDNGEPAAGAALGPVAVLPEHQGQGIGSALIRSGLNRLRETDLPFCAVLGHSTYYPRFGFEPSVRFGIRSQWDVPPEVFMIQPLRPEALADKTGIVIYADAFLDV